MHPSFSMDFTSFWNFQKPPSGLMDGRQATHQILPNTGFLKGNCLVVNP